MKRLTIIEAMLDVAKVLEEASVPKIKKGGIDYYVLCVIEKEKPKGVKHEDSKKRGGKSRQKRRYAHKPR